MEYRAEELQDDILARLPGETALAPYVTAIAALKDYQSTNAELIAASALLDDCAVLEQSTVACLAKDRGGVGERPQTAVRRALSALSKRGLVGEWKAQRVAFEHEKDEGSVRAYPASGRQSYWYRTGD